MPVKFTAAGAYIPENVITNDDLAARYKTVFDLSRWITLNLGISERRQSDLLPSDQAVIAARNALKQVEGTVDFLILNTFNGDYILPQTATLVQHKLGLRNCFALELNMPCAGPVYNIAVAVSFLLTNKYERGLLIGVDKMSSILDPNDHLMNALFGEAAGALIVERTSGEAGIVDYFLESEMDGDLESDYALTILEGRAAYPPSDGKILNRRQYLQMNATKTKSFIIDKLTKTVEWVLGNQLLRITDIDYVICHQANRKLIERTLEGLGIDRKKILFTVDYLGNTCSASIFVTISEYFYIFQHPGKNILICGMGGGLTWGGIFYRT